MTEFSGRATVVWERKELFFSETLVVLCSLSPGEHWSLVGRLPQSSSLAGSVGRVLASHLGWRCPSDISGTGHWSAWSLGHPGKPLQYWDSICPSFTRDYRIKVNIKKLKWFITVGVLNVYLTVTNVLCSISCYLGSKQILHSLSISNSLLVISLSRCIVPQLQVLNPVMTFGRCFLKFPYQQMLTLVNDSDLPGCYKVLPQVWHCICLFPSMLLRCSLGKKKRGLDKTLQVYIQVDSCFQQT